MEQLQIALKSKSSTDFWKGRLCSSLILFAFVLLEVLIFKKDGNYLLFIPIVEYLLILLITLVDKEMGVWYYLAFTLLAFGFGNYSDLEGIYPSNFWGLRLFGVSFNIVFSILLCGVCYIKDRKHTINIAKDIVGIFFYIYLFWSFVIGFVNVIKGGNYADDFVADFFTYFPYIIYVYLIGQVETSKLIFLVKQSVPLTLFGMVLCVLFKKYFVYSVDYYVPANTFYFVLPIMLIAFGAYFRKFNYLLLCLSFFFVVAMGKFFFGGKVIIMIILMIAWKVINNFKINVRSITVLSLFTIFLLFLNPILVFIISFFDNSSVIGHKLRSISEALDLLSLKNIAVLPTSMGNLAAEYLTIVADFFNNKLHFLFGKGFGGGVKDVYGYLSIWTENDLNGYKPLDASRDNFFKMHLSVFEVFVKSGVFITGLFFYILSKSFFSKSKYDFVFFVLLFSVFYSHKEILLLTVLFGEISRRLNATSRTVSVLN